MNKLIFLRGCPGSGKSTYYWKFLKDHPDYVGYSVDMITYNLFGFVKWENFDTNLVLDYQNMFLWNFFNFSINHSKNIIVDNINIDTWVYDKFIEVLEYNYAKDKYTIEYIDFNISLDELLKRNQWRHDNDPDMETSNERIINLYWEYQKVLKNENKI